MKLATQSRLFKRTCNQLGSLYVCHTMYLNLAINSRDSSAPLRPVKKVQLGILSPEEIVSDAIYRVTT